MSNIKKDKLIELAARVTSAEVCGRRRKEGRPMEYFKVLQRWKDIYSKSHTKQDLMNIIDNGLYEYREKLLGSDYHIN